MDRGLFHVEGHDKGKVESQLVISICLNIKIDIMQKSSTNNGII